MLRSVLKSIPDTIHAVSSDFVQPATATYEVSGDRVKNLTIDLTSDEISNLQNKYHKLI